MIWYRDNGYPSVANQIVEYGFSYCQYSYSLPRPLSELFKLFMQINYEEYFHALGFSEELYDPGKREFERDEIIANVNGIIEFWRAKYPRLEFDVQSLRFENILNFNYSFTRELTNLKFE
jgi:hypothetical protein